MAYEEGFWRIKFVVRLILLSGVSLVVTSIAGGVVSWVLSNRPVATSSPLLFLFAVIGAYATVFGGILWGCLWIVEGFVRDANTRRR